MRTLRKILAAVSLLAAFPFASALAEDAPAGAAEITFPTQVQLGNIFTLGEKVELEAAVQTGTAVEWTVRDFEDKQVAAGTTPVTDRKARFAPGVDAKGYYLVQLTSKTGRQVHGEAQTSYAVIAPADLAKLSDSKFGVMTHFAQNMPTDILGLMAKAGAVSVRDEQYWGAVEKAKGQYLIPERYQKYMDELKALGLDPLFVASFGNTLYDNQPKIPSYKLAPYSREGYEGYANYCLAVLKHYGPQIRAVEIWNEYNGTFCAGKAAEDRPKHYTEMLRVAYEKIKAARPDVKVLGGATVKIPLPYLEKLFQRGALKYMDAVAVHPYQSPESVEQDVAELVALMKKHNGGKAKPIWATETSYMHDHTTQRVEAASHMVRMFTLLQTQPAVERIYWYLCCDYRKEFARLGLVHSDVDPMGKYTPVATYPAYANLVRRFHRAKFARREATDSRTRVYRFDKPGETLWVCWSTFETAELVLSAGGPVRRVSLVGGDETLAPTGGKIRVPVGETPFYLVAGEGVVTAVAETPRNDEVLADSARDFSGTQGAGGWSYFYYVSNQDGSAPYQPEKVQPMKWLPSPGDWADMWTGPAKWYTISAGGAQPAVLDGAQGWTVLRWTSDTDGPVHLIVKLRRGRNGDGVGCKIFLDGKEIHSKHLPPGATESIDLTPTVHKGSRVDFVVTPGPALDSNHDSATLRATILTPPKT